MKEQHMHGDLMTFIAAALTMTALSGILSPRRGAALRILEATGVAFDNVLADVTGRPRLPHAIIGDVELEDDAGGMLTDLTGFDAFISDRWRQHEKVATVITAPRTSGGGFVQHAPAHRSRRPGAGGDRAEYFGDSPEIDD